MSRGGDDTTIGGGQHGFQTTRWTEVERAKTLHQERRNASINNLMERYWKPVYCCLRRKGYSNDDSKDLTQGFFCEIVLGRELIQQAEQAKGRFRTFLLTALDRYVASARRKETAKKRLPVAGLVSLEAESLPEMPVDEARTSPERAFCYAWATSILDQVLEELREEYCGTGRSAHWEVFRHKVLLPIFEGVQEPPLSEVCTVCNIESKKQVSNMLITVRRRFAVVIRRILRQYVKSESQVDQELSDLLDILHNGGAA